MLTSTCIPDAPLVSVIIPYYNRPTLLSRALLSVERQSYRNIETIVVDDGSTPSPARLIADLGLSRRVALLRHPVNRGPGAARNTGVDAAAGAFVTFLDSDDEYDALKIENQMAEIAKAPPGRIFCASSTRLVGQDGARETLCEPWNPDVERLAGFLFLRGGSVTVNAMMVSKDLAQTVRFAETLRDFEDNLFAILCCARADRVLFAANACSRYYDDGRADRLTRKSSKADGFEFLRLCRDVLTEPEIIAFHVKIMGSTLLFSEPWRFFLNAARGVAGGVFSLRRVAGLVYGYAKLGYSRRAGA